MKHNEQMIHHLFLLIKNMFANWCKHMQWCNPSWFCGDSRRLPFPVGLLLKAPKQLICSFLITVLLCSAGKPWSELNPTENPQDNVKITFCSEVTYIKGQWQVMSAWNHVSLIIAKHARRWGIKRLYQRLEILNEMEKKFHILKSIALSFYIELQMHHWTKYVFVNSIMFWQTFFSVLTVWSENSSIYICNHPAIIEPLYPCGYSSLVNLLWSNLGLCLTWMDL